MLWFTTPINRTARTIFSSTNTSDWLTAAEATVNEVAFSGAEEFLDKYKDKVDDAGIIGHFGLGFYSAFMVSDKVEIITKD